MLIYPKQGSNIITVAGIDPGSINLGVAFLEFDITTMQITSSTAASYNSDVMCLDDDLLAYTHDERFNRILAQKDNLLRLFKYYRPSIVCCESPFYNRLRPSAFGPLVEVLSCIKTATREYSPLVKLHFYPPSIIKKSLGGSAFADKKSIKEQILAIDDWCYKGSYPLSSLDEHALDALATCRCHFKTLQEEYKRCLVKPSSFLLTV